MWVRLTHNQFHAIATRVPDWLVDTMREHRVVRGATQHDYLLPAVGWRHVLDVMAAALFTPTGGRIAGKGRPPDSAYAAVGRVAKALKRFEAHPGLREAAAVGWVGDVLPAWRDVTQPFWCYPYPAQGREFVLLAPSHITIHKQKMTVWSRSSGFDRGLLEPQCLAYQEHFHLLVWGQI